MARRGAGGTDGGTLTFLVGIAMIICGGYLLLNAIVVRPNFGFGTRVFGIGGVPVTTGMILFPFIFGVGFIFYNARSWIGWALAGGSVLAMVAGVIASLRIQMAAMSIFDLMVILILLVGGIGLSLRSLRES